MTNTPAQPDRILDRTLEHTIDRTPADDLRGRIDQVLTIVDLNDVLARIEAQVIAARAAIADEAEGPLTHAVNTLVVEAFLAHRVVSTW